MAMFTAFLFMQKVIFLLAFCCSGFLSVVCRQNFCSGFLKALILPCIGGIVFLAWLLAHDMVGRYWLANYIFNLHIPDVYGGLVENQAGILCCQCLGFMRLHLLIVSGKHIRADNLSAVGFRSFATLFLFFAGQALLLSAANIQRDACRYICVGNNKKWRIAAYVFAVLSLSGCLVFRNYCLENRLKPYYHRYVTPKYVLEQTNRCDVVINGYGLTYGIFPKM